MQEALAVAEFIQQLRKFPDSKEKMKILFFPFYLLH